MLKGREWCQKRRWSVGLSVSGVAWWLIWAVSGVAWAHLGGSGWLIWVPGGRPNQRRRGPEPYESWFCGESCCGPSQKLVGTHKYARKSTIPSGRSICAVWRIWGILPRNHPPNKRKRALGGPEEAGSLRSHSHEGSLGSHSHEALGATATRP